MKARHGFRGFWLALVTCTFALSGCAAAILSVGPEETTFIHKGSTKQAVWEALGTPIASIKLVPAVPAQELSRQPNIEMLVAHIGVDQGQFVFPSTKAVSLETYEYIGVVQQRHDVGEAMAVSGYTFLLAELFMVPMAIKERTRADARKHIVKVWYASDDIALAYDWHSVKN